MPDTAKKIEKISPDAFYVFDNQPYILFFDISNSDHERETEIHKKVWSFDQSPLVFILKDSEVNIFNAFAYDKKIKRLEEIKLKSGEELDEIFSFWNLQSGNTWLWLQSNHYKKVQDKRVNQKLFENIKFVRASLTDETLQNFLDDDEANILILRLIFIRYLIDREVKLDEAYVHGSTILDKRKSFTDLIEKPRKLNEFFEWLNAKFNGVLFKDIKVQLSKEMAKALALVFSGELPEKGGLFEGTDFYFEVFDFSIIPVELISGIYESLIDKETRKLHSAVYTPSFLVENILTNTIDKFFREKANKSISECKVFDPSVGSGIFLVQAFRRMVDRELEITKQERVKKDRLREIVQNNLFGVDINDQALKVTCFSIYIAMLDYIDPRSILPVFHFPTLIGSNLFASDFFNVTNEFNTVIKEKGMHFILGNPPWKQDKTTEHLKWINSQKIYSKKVVGGIEIAQNFLLRCGEFMQSYTSASLIVTSTIFYNVATTTKEFKNKFLTTFCVNNFFDLSAVKQSLFEQQESPASIVTYRLSKDKEYESNTVKHQSLKANMFLKYFKTLVIEKFDYKEILQRHFLENDWMFKVALYGNSLDFLLLKKLQKQSSLTLNDLVDGQTLLGSSGILKGTPKKPYDFLLGLPINENEEINKYFTQNSSTILKKEDVFLEAGRTLSNFSTDKILFKEQAKNWTEIIISYNEKPSVYKKGIFGLSSEDRSLLKKIYALLISELYEYFIFISSGSWGVSTRPQIRWEEEYLAFPYTEPAENVGTQLIELVDTFLSPFAEHYKTFNLGKPLRNEAAFNEINSIVEKLYNIDGYEKDLIDYALNIARYQFQEGKMQRIVRKVDTDEIVLNKYADVFFNEFKNVYEGEYLQVQVYPLDYFIAMSFYFVQDKPQKRVTINREIKNEIEVFRLIANNLSISEISKDLYIQKDIKGFENNSFYIIKPNEYKSWHSAIAWYDVAEIKKIIEDAEIEYLQSTSDGR